VKYIQMNREKLMKMAGSVRTGGKGTMRRYCIAVKLLKIQTFCAFEELKFRFFG